MRDRRKPRLNTDSRRKDVEYTIDTKEDDVFGEMFLSISSTTHIFTRFTFPFDFTQNNLNIALE